MALQKLLRLCLHGILLTVGIHPLSVWASQVQSDCVPILEPLSGGASNCIPIEPGLQTWMTYFGQAAPWLYNVAVGICIVWMLLSGLQITISSDDDGKRQEAIGRMKAAVLGLVILIFGGVILRALNSVFFV